MQNTYDAIVVGSGPGGATVARGLAMAGKEVLLLEKGKDHQNLGTYAGALSIVEKAGFFKSREGVAMLMASSTGGATTVYSGSAAMPPPWLKDRYGIDLGEYADQTWKELNVAPLPDFLLGDASKRIMNSANRLGYDWNPTPKLFDLEKVKTGCRCGAATSLGCACGAKWTAREYIHDAVGHGAELITQAECTDVLVENGCAAGVRATVSGQGLQVFHAALVILAGGGIPSPRLLLKAGINHAGKSCVIDPTVLLYGISPFKGSCTDPLVSVDTWEFCDTHGVRMGTLIDPKLMTYISLGKAGLKHLPKGRHYKNMVGILIKIKDKPGGWVDQNGNVSKELTEADFEKLAMGKTIATEILTASGCAPSSIVASPVRGAHPSGTCGIGAVVDTNLQTGIKNLYVCDASVFPEALDRPTVITIISFGKRLVDHLLKEGND
ncbi:ferredoxin [Desulfoluna limicola]|uniref:Ferredoxin n=1 Tax=Desulfoluna limicola TaxID=2810562 RepID=A0ABM7PNL7_9BACT|nr:GMC family oxidoreductase N-terminal domain-containing protein [Desulfoluna limicola]BCS98991.1 ferredoxin [Desulfoluna limicola]